MKCESRTRKVSILALMTALLTLVYIFGASPYASDGTSGTLQAQGSNGAITGLTLTSDTPGTLTVSWDTTSPVPTDHRVDWAKSGEDYQSWKVDDGHKYPAPTATSVTIADLEHDTEYKIRLRARYYSGEYEGKSWGGPWAEATLQVAGEPDTPSNTVTRDADPPEPTLPATPSLINTAVTEGQVLLSWFKPSDDSITGYQILRGPDASNLVVIEDDTGSSSTSYTDTAPPAGQTHTYGVKARNSAGLSPAGTATATVPAAEVLIVAQQRGIVKLGGNGTVNTGIVGVGYQEPGIGSVAQNRYFGYATSFTPGGDGWYHLSSIGFSIQKEDARLIRVAIHEDDSSGPADAALYVAYMALEKETAGVAHLRTTFPENATLEAGKTYWAVFDEITGSGLFHLFLAEDTTEDAGFESWAIGDVGYEINYLAATGFTWEAASDDTTLLRNVEPILMTFHGYAEPERVLVGAHGLRNTDDDGPLLRFGTERVTKTWLNLPKDRTFDFCEPAFVAGSDTETSWRLCDLSTNKHYNHEWAGGRGFTTGPNPTGYTITSLGVDMDAEDGAISPQASIYNTNAFQTTGGSLDPQSPLANYQAQAAIGGSPNSFAPRTGSEEAQLESNSTYVAYFENDATGYFETPNARAGQDAGAEDGWTLGYPYGGKFVHPLGFAGESWNFGEGDSRRIPLNIHGWPNPLVAAPNPKPPAPGQTLISNLDLTPGDPFLLQRREFLTRAIASPFTTGSHGAGYALHGLQIELQNQPVEFVGGIRAAIHNDNDGEPGAFLHELGLQVNLQKGIATFHAPASTSLAANTTYWLIVSAESILAGTQQVVMLLANWDQDDSNVRSGCYARDWSIGNFNYWRATSTFPWNGSPDAIKMAILGERVSDPSVESSEPTCDDLPESTATTGRLIVDDDGVKGQHQAQGDADWYSVDLEADTYYQFTANPRQTQSRLYLLRIFDDAGVELRNSSIESETDADGGESYHAVDRLNSLPYRTNSTGAGTYYVSIEEWKSNDPDAVYTLTAFDDDYSDGITTTATVTVSADGRSFESFQNYLMRTEGDNNSSATNDVDWIRVALKAGATYKIVYDVACLHEGLIYGVKDTSLNTLPDTYGVVSRRTDGFCSNVTIEFSPESGGDHFIAVSARGSYFRETSEEIDQGVNPFMGVVGTLTVTDITPNYPATGDPLVRGERKVGSTLVGDTTGVADGNGLTNPMLEYQWQRMEDGIQTDIPGAVSNAYRLTEGDEDKRVRLQVRFDDDYDYHEIRSGPATSLVAPEAPRILVGNFNQTDSSSFTTTDISNGFVSGAHPHGYAIDEITFRRAYNTPASNDEAEFRLYTSTSNTDARERKPDTRIMTVSGPNRVVTSNIWFNAQSRVKLEPSTTYHAVLTTTSASDVIGCSGVTGGGEDSTSLPGFEIIDRHYVYPNSAIGFTDDRSCTIQITGFELATPNFVESVEFTSSPTQPDMYAIGELIEAKATLNQAVAFDGPPVILLQIGDNERRMEYVASDSTDTSWVFRYTVVADDQDDDGVSINQNALRGYANADLSHYGIINDQAHHVNAAPRVVSHRVSSSPLAQFRYGPSEEIQFTLEFSLPVTVVGNPRLEFNTDTPASQNEFASYLSGSGTRELVFSYTVLTVDEDLNGIEWGANSLQLVDGIDEITGVYNGLAAILDHTALNRLQGHRINQRPWPVSQDVTSDPTHGMDSDTYGAGDVITLTVVFNQVVTVTGAPQLRFRIGSSRNAAYVSGSGTNTLVFSYTVLATDIEPDSIHLFGNAFEPFNYPDTAVDAIVGTSNNLPAINIGVGNAGSFPGHKVDGTITN